MRLDAFLPLVLIALSVHAIDPLRPHAKQSRAYDEAATGTTTTGSTHTNMLSEHVTLVQYFQPALTSATATTNAKLEMDGGRDLDNTDKGFEAQKTGEKHGQSAKPRLGTRQRLSTKAVEHLAAAIGDTTFSTTKRNDRSQTRSRRIERGTRLNRRNTVRTAECDCPGKVSDKYKIATVVLSVIVGLEVLLPLVWVCFGSLLMGLVAYHLG